MSTGDHKETAIETSREMFENLLRIPSLAHFIYYLVVLATGILFLQVSLRDGIEFGRSLLYMFVWFVLIAALQPPEGARYRSKPFEEVDVLDA